MTLPDLSALGLEISAKLRLWHESVIDRAPYPEDKSAHTLAKQAADTIDRLITALSEARADVERLHQAVYDIGKEAELIMHDRDNVRYELSEARGREASFVDQVCELHRMLSETRAREAAARERQPAPEPVDSGGNDDTWRGL